MTAAIPPRIHQIRLKLPVDDDALGVGVTGLGVSNVDGVTSVVPDVSDVSCVSSGFDV